MSDTNDRPVSMRKAAASPGTGASRPATISALAAAMLLSGLAAVIAAITLYGQHDYLVRTLAKSQPDAKITNSVISTVSGTAGSTLTGDLTPLVGRTLTGTEISAEAGKVASAVRTALPARFATDDEIKTQADKSSSAVKSALGKLSGPLTAAQLTAQGKDLAATVKSNLTDLQKSQLSPQQIKDKADKAPTQILIQNLLLLVALGLVGVGAYVGRHWARWAVPVIWVLASFTGTAAGFTSVLQLGSDLPAGYKLGGAVSGLSLIAAVVLGLLKPSKLWYEAHRPAPVDGARRGLFGPRVPPPSARNRPARGGATTRPGGRFAPRTPAIPADAGSSGSAGAPSRPTSAKAKQRAAAESASKGASAARARAKTASKSRRTIEG